MNKNTKKVNKTNFLGLLVRYRTIYSVLYG